MSYVDNNLMKDEEIIYKAKLHWMIYLNGIIVVIFGIFIFLVSSEFQIPGVVFMIIGLILLIKAYIFKISTELVITSKRVIAKFGFIRRNTIELNHSKVESLSVHQNILERILNSGDIILNGTGGGKTPIPNIDNPLIFRTKAMETIG